MWYHFADKIWLLLNSAEYHSGMWIMTLIQWTVFFSISLLLSFYLLDTQTISEFQWSASIVPFMNVDPHFARKTKRAVTKKRKISWLAAYQITLPIIHTVDTKIMETKEKKCKIYTISFYFVCVFFFIRWNRVIHSGSRFSGARKFFCSFF